MTVWYQKVLHHNACGFAAGLTYRSVNLIYTRIQQPQRLVLGVME